MRCTWSWHVFQKNLGAYQEWLQQSTLSWVLSRVKLHTIHHLRSKQQAPLNQLAVSQECHQKGTNPAVHEACGKKLLRFSTTAHFKEPLCHQQTEICCSCFTHKKGYNLSSLKFKTCLNCRTICQSCSQCIGIKAKSYSSKHLICFYMSGSIPARGARALLVSPAKPKRINSIHIHLHTIMGNQSRWLIHTCSGLNLDTGCGAGPGKDSASKSVSNGRAFAASACFAVFSKSSVNSSTCTMHEQNGRSVQYFLRSWSPVIMQTLHLWWRLQGMWTELTGDTVVNWILAQQRTAWSWYGAGKFRRARVLCERKIAAQR
jgi:hypothetical protein